MSKKYKALCSFCGAINMSQNEIKPLSVVPKKVIDDLISVGYIEEVVESTSSNDQVLPKKSLKKDKKESMDKSENSSIESKGEEK